MIAEIWGTFLFTLVILTVVGKSGTPGNGNGRVNGFVIITTLYVAITTAGVVSGGGMNPAVALALNGMGTVFFKTDGAIAALWAYIVGPLLGAALAGFFYKAHHGNLVRKCTVTEKVNTLLGGVHEMVDRFEDKVKDSF